jgi:hypothetical protein
LEQGDAALSFYESYGEGIDASAVGVEGR